MLNKLIRKTFFLFSESFKGLFRAKLPAFISSVTIAITLVIFTISIYAYENLVGFSHKFKSQFSVEVFFDEEISLSDARDLFNYIILIEGIEQGEFIDKKRASAVFKKHFNYDITAIIGENPLPMGGNFDISNGYRDIDSMARIVNSINKLHGVDEVLYQYGVISKIDRIIQNSIGMFMVVGLFILIISIILVSNTIRLIVYAKKEDIVTLNLLGATNLFIKLPFLIEGFLQGVFGSFLSLFILYFVYSMQIYILDSLININPIIPTYIIPGNIIAGIFLGLTGSYRGITRGISKYIKL